LSGAGEQPAIRSAGVRSCLDTLMILAEIVVARTVRDSVVFP
jgi:hypothetical protein